MDDSYEMTLVEADWIEINPKGLNKGNALKKYAESLKFELGTDFNNDFFNRRNITL